MWRSLRRYIKKNLFQKERPVVHLKHRAKFYHQEDRVDMFSSIYPAKYNGNCWTLYTKQMLRDSER